MFQNLGNRVSMVYMAELDRTMHQLHTTYKIGAKIPAESKGPQKRGSQELSDIESFQNPGPQVSRKTPKNGPNSWTTPTLSMDLGLSFETAAMRVTVGGEGSMQIYSFFCGSRDTHAKLSLFNITRYRLRGAQTSELSLTVNHDRHPAPRRDCQIGSFNV